MTAVGIGSAAIWVFALRRHFIDETLPAREAQVYTVRAVITPVIFVLSIAVAYVDTTAAMWIWSLSLLMRIVSDRLLH